MGARDFVDSMSELMKVMQLRSYFTEKQEIENNSQQINTANKLKNSIMKNKVSLYPTIGKQSFLVSGKDILKVKKELKDIGAIWNEDYKSVELSKDCYINNIDKETKQKVEKDIQERREIEINTIRDKIVNKDLEMVSENGKYKVVGYTNDIQSILGNIGFEKNQSNYYIDKDKFKSIFTPEITKLVDIYNNEYSAEPEQKVNESQNQRESEEKQKIRVEVCIVDMNNKGNNKWIELPISRLNFSKTISQFNSDNLKITKVWSNDKDIQNVFKGKNNTADVNTIHKFNVLTRKLNDLSNDKLQEYKDILKVEGLNNINDYINCADELRQEQNMEMT